MSSAVMVYERRARFSGRISPSRLVILGFLLFWSFAVLVPLGVIVLFSFFQVKNYRVVYTPSLDTWRSLVASGRWLVTLRTLRIALTVTAIELAMAIPFGFWLAKICRSKVTKAVLVTLLTIPFFLDASSRIIVWRSILGTNGAINTLLLHLGVIQHPVEWLLYSEFAVHFGLVGSYFPTMLFPIFMIMTVIDDEYLQASNDLGAGPFLTFLYVVIPMALPGIVAGIVFTLVPLMAAFVEPQMLGGGFVNLLGDSVSSALSQLKYPTAAALSTVVVALLGLCLLLLAAVTRNRFEMSSMFKAVHR